jgi:hypothetical protein
MVQAYCQFCRMIKEIQNPREVQLRSGSEEDFQDPEYVGPVTGAAIVGMCPHCGSNLHHKLGVTDDAE